MGIEKQISRIRDLAEAKEKNKEEIDKIERGLVDHILLMEEILQSIPDVVGVIRPDYTMAFFNYAGYKLFNKTRDQVRQRKCYELFNRTEKCENCTLDHVISSKKELTYDKFVDELGRFMDFFFKPVLDEKGNVDLIILKMRDITDQKLVEEQLQMQEKVYRRIFELSPYGILIVRDKKIIMLNSEAIKGLGYKEKDLKNINFRDIVHEDYIQRAMKIFKSLENKQVLKAEAELVFIKKDGKKAYMDIIASRIDFIGINSLLVTLRDTSKIKSEMDKASKIQKVRMGQLPKDLEKIKFARVYIPKSVVSGDFFHIFSTGENEMVGFLGDSNGNGVSAALLNSAVKVIINDIITKTTEPEEFLNMLHDIFQPLFEEDFIAAICFKIDFLKKKITITSAGINEYIIERKGSPTLSVLKGPPIGGKMPNTSFDTMVHDFCPGDRIYVFSDGFDKTIQDIIFKEKIYKKDIEMQKEYIEDYFAKPDNIHDDAMWIAIESLPEH